MRYDRRGWLRTASLGGVLLLAASGGTGCRILFNPGAISEVVKGATFGDEEELLQSRKVAGALSAKYGPYRDPVLEEYVNLIGQRIVAVARKDRPEIPEYSFRVVDEPGLNAFTIGGGYIYVHADLVARLESEAQLATVLGHEVAHVTREHIQSQVRATTWSIVAGTAVGEIFEIAGRALDPSSAPGPDELTPGFAAAIAAVSANGFSRGDEEEADHVGLRYALDAGYDPREMTRTFEIFAQEYGDSGVVDNFIYGSHPTNAARIEYLREDLAELAPELEGKRLVVESSTYAKVVRGARLDLAAAYLSRGGLAPARALLERAARVRIGDAPEALAHVLLGDLDRKQGSRETAERAVVHYRRALEIAPDAALAWRGLGLVHDLQLGRPDLALEAYARYLTLSPKAEDAATIRASILRLGGEA